MILDKAIPYGKQEITDADIAAVVAALQSDFLTQGPRVAEFEQHFAKYIGAKYAVAVSNGTTALHLAALSLGVDNNSKALTTPITFAATANCILYCGGKVDFADIDPSTYTLDLNQVETKLRRGGFTHILPTDFAGLPVDMQALRQLADHYGCKIIEDACHAPGGYFTDTNGKVQLCGNGAFAETAVFSFHPVKHIACGEGGMITTNDTKIYDQLMLLRTHGITKNPTQMQIPPHTGEWYYEMQELGYNYRLPDILAALGTSQLQRADENLYRRQKIAQNYYHQLADLPLVLPYVPTGYQHAFHLFVVLTAQRLELYQYLKSVNIHTQVHYIPVHMLPYYRGLGFKAGDFPNAENYYNQCLSLPMYHALTLEQQLYTVEHLTHFFQPTYNSIN